MFLQYFKIQFSLQYFFLPRVTAQSAVPSSKKLPNIISPDFKAQMHSSPAPPAMKESPFSLHPTPTPSSNADNSQSPNLDGVGGVLARGSHEHNFLDFLQPNNIRDKNKLRPDHPNYNRRTLHVTETFLRFLPGHTFHDIYIYIHTYKCVIIVQRSDSSDGAVVAVQSTEHGHRSIFQSGEIL